MDMERLRKALAGARVCYDPKMSSAFCEDRCPYGKTENDREDCCERLQADMVAVIEEIAAEKLADQDDTETAKSRVLRKQEAPEKPPMGVKPFFIAIPDRIRELSEAISRNPESENVGQWAQEIGMHASTLSSMREE